MTGPQGREGVILPGFDCSTGQAVGYTRAEWVRHCIGMTIERRAHILFIRNVNNQLCFEVYVPIGVSCASCQIQLQTKDEATSL